MAFMATPRNLRFAARPGDPDPRGTAEVAAVPTLYRGILFRSALEAGWAGTLDHYGIEWQYEPVTLRLPSGTWYLPDLWLPDLRTYIEVKGNHMERAAKPEELAEGGDLTDVIVLLGFPPVQRSVEPYLWDPYMQWRDPLQYDTRFTRCPACEGWQWIRGELSRSCRLCGATITGVLAQAGEMPFMPAEPDGPSWLRRR